jgi:hypothetical protein
LEIRKRYDDTPSLGTKYQEGLRKYLLSREPFPETAALWVSIIRDSMIWNLVTTPYGGKTHPFWSYRFQLLGISFMFFLGNRIDSVIRESCSFRSPKQFIFLSDEASKMVIRDFGKLIKESRLVNPR